MAGQPDDAVFRVIRIIYQFKSDLSIYFLRCFVETLVITTCPNIEVAVPLTICSCTPDGYTVQAICFALIGHITIGNGKSHLIVEVYTGLALIG